jgi:hypothetical protein
MSDVIVAGITLALDAAQPVAIYNHDIVGIYNRLNRFQMELIGCQSSDLSMTSKYDMDRLSSYLDALDKYHDWVLAADQLDLPETKGFTYTLELAPVVPALENEDLEDMIRMLQLARRELVNSQSARAGTGFPVKQDSSRLRSITDKARKFLTTYMTPVQPLDLPVSSPLDLATPNPNHGV